MVSQGGRPFSLPQELLEEIFQKLDVESVLSLRLACRFFYVATASTWLYLAREIHSKPQTPRSEEPLEDYTSEELRHWVLRLHRAEQVWNAPSVADFYARKTKNPIRSPIVLPGGRWFLSVSGWGEILAVDMDSPQMESKSLVKVSPYIEGTDLEDRPGKFSIWVDLQAPRLTFRIALVNPEPQTMYFDAEGRTRVHVFHAHTLGHGKDATLVAEPFRQYEGVFTGGTRLMAVNGRYFVQVKEIYGPGGDFDIYVFDCEKDFYTRGRLCSLKFPVVGHSSLILVDVFIPSDDKVTIISRDTVYIYAIPTTSSTSGSESWYPIHTIPLKMMTIFAKRSVPYVGKTSTTIIYPRVGMVALEVPHNIGEKHYTTPIATFPNRYGAPSWRTVGLFDTLDHQVDSVRRFLKILRYPWDPLSEKGPRGATISSHEVDIPFNAFPSDRLSVRLHSFHTDIGRLVVLSTKEDLLHVYDLIPVKKPKG